MGCAILPHLKNLVETIEAGLEDEQQKVRSNLEFIFYLIDTHCYLTGLVSRLVSTEEG